jgi:hypothetical protein
MKRFGPVEILPASVPSSGGTGQAQAAADSHQLFVQHFLAPLDIEYPQFRAILKMWCQVSRCVHKKGDFVSFQF